MYVDPTGRPCTFAEWRGHRAANPPQHHTRSTRNGLGLHVSYDGIWIGPGPALPWTVELSLGPNQPTLVWKLATRDEAVAHAATLEIRRAARARAGGRLHPAGSGHPGTGRGHVAAHHPVRIVPRHLRGAGDQV